MSLVHFILKIWEVSDFMKKMQKIYTDGMMIQAYSFGGYEYVITFLDERLATTGDSEVGFFRRCRVG